MIVTRRLRFPLLFALLALAVSLPIRASDAPDEKDERNHDERNEEDAPPASGEAAKGRAAVIFVHGAIGPALAAAVERRLERILDDDRYDTLIVDTDSPGGELGASMDAADMIFDAGTDGRLRTVTWVDRDAISGAALTALAARDIYMLSGGSIGDCQPIILSAGGYEALGEKVQSPLRQRFENYARRNGYPIPLAHSMVTQEYAVYRVTWPDGTVEWFEDRELRERELVPPAERRDESWWERALRPKRDKPTIELIVAGGELPTWGDVEALEYGISRGTFKDRDALLRHLGYDPKTDVDTFPITWSERASEMLLGIRWLLLLVGLGSLYLEFKAPGFGVAGILGLVAFGLYFFAGYIGGLADHVEILLFLVGVALIAVELFVIPGVGIAGFLGLACVVVGLYLASTPFLVPDTPVAREYLYDWARDFAIGLSGLVAVAILATRYLPGIPMFNRLLLVPPGSDPRATAAMAETRARPLVGRVGLAKTDLRPSGRIMIDDEPYDVVTDGRFVAAGAEVEVVQVRGNRIQVVPRGPAP